MVDEINSLTNLVGLCPNHHWEFDNNLLLFDEKWLEDK
jgi:predicted restriction endonuclease